MRFANLLAGVALAVIAATTPVHAQTSGQAGQPVQSDAGQDGDVSAEEILVTADIAFRNRTNDPNPVLSYDLEYFQRFEPVSVGEMLKRVPGVTFTSDVLEYDQVQFRGLPPGFTQVLINGRRAPGGEADRSFFVDRIPAELVERIEIVRAPRADQPSEGVAGTLNIVTKESTQFEGGFVKAGALINADGEFRPSGAIAYAGKLGPDTDFWTALNYQERRNPKRKISYRFGGVPQTVDGGEADYIVDPEFDDLERQDDTRDGRDLSGSAEIVHRFGGGGRIRLGGFFVDTNRTESEVSDTFEGGDLDFVERATQVEDISQQTYALSGDGVIPLGGIELGFAGGWSAYREDTTALEVVENFEDDEIEEETSIIDLRDDEYSGTLFARFGKGSGLEVKAGIDLLSKQRDGFNNGDLIEDDFAFDIEEERYDPYVRLTLNPTPDLTIDAGLRYEITRRSVTVEDDPSVDYDSEMLNPSLHLRYAADADGQFRGSVARTVRRPNYDLLSPYEQEESPGDNDVTIGNPALRNERAWGVDVGYERRLGTSGIAGINFFYRDVTDLIELVAIGDNGEDGNVYTPRNIGDGQTWGVEVDLSAPLTAFGMPDTGLFANYTYLDSSTIDPFTREDRRFNNQPHHIYNVGFIQSLRALGASFGATISGRSGATESNFDEIIDLRYDPDLEAFLEKRFGERFVLRFSVQNILNRQKKEDFRVFDGDSLGEILENRAAGEIDEYEIERERAGQLFQVTLRAAF
ncbi:TonB-dependent receptor plug domain-containing protein [Sphingomonas japonica]|uniref:Outer membrane receptor protein involved in Fe transport n=1 Tax=Sphingomonas japonica TaxID=511662 RepID=A0ABX0U3I7_9SPHN|nr:TonB-dependent receptor [Sphingomonas japonica]NIJ25145.1 outer membrane receptor protein involved in Fe transport [Sphingomonas japonica]